ncbi:MAG: type II secretion system secretin GspD [Candidatus Thiocaldithrix dubininis]|uniref:Type II secretion system secretin GspD n=1 Tax=Candidatus Thiocaldithrix dubininis TaxID=3080823 RepID=A0AA95HA38_9GAMM|nr:MAG: type II secretion system secretin GspD [Candidatus Thiocaldithrix dubininis]
MNYKHPILGLISVAVLMSTAMADNRSGGANLSGFQRSGAVKASSHVSDLEISYPGTIPTPSNMASSNAREASATHTNTHASKDVELILGDKAYYRNDVSAPAVNTKSSKGSGIALNFERASIREVVKVVLGDVLKVTYTVEPGVEGEVTINSSAPIDRDALIPTLEALLQTQGAALYKDDTGTYRIASRANLKGRGLVPSTGTIKPGYGIQVVPLRYIPATEMQKILEPLAAPEAFVRVDTSRNLLVLAGTSSELANLAATVKTFDVDMLKGMSVGLYRVKNVEAAIVAKNLDALFGETGNSPIAGMIKIMPIEHMNSIMIISPNPDYLKDMKDWVDRFDQVTGGSGQQLFVYHVQSGNAEHLADMLNQIFGGKKSSSSSKFSANNAASLAPGLDPASVGQAAAVENAIKAGEQAAGADSAKTMLGGDGLSINPDAEVKIVADKTNNSLMIMSSEAVYKQIVEALKRIDVMPMQVQVEATIMEVTLTDGLEYGLQWYLSQSGKSFGQNGLTNLKKNTDGSLATPGGFSFSLTGGADRVMGVINALARQSKVRVLSSPSILVLDNQTASIKVGDQQPIVTGTLSTPSGSTSGSFTTTSTVQYKDTGVSLQVTPSVNASGLVKMDIQQDITDVGEVDSATGNRSFLQRNIKSNVAVKSGETIVLGGLIRDNAASGRTGTPGLSKLPVVGGLFGSNSSTGKRTELLVLITPTAIKDQRELVKTGEEMRDRMQQLMSGDKFIPELSRQNVK